MSRKTHTREPLRSLPPLPATPRWAPSTPHTNRALQPLQQQQSRQRQQNSQSSQKSHLQQTYPWSQPRSQQRQRLFQSRKSGVGVGGGETRRKSSNGRPDSARNILRRLAKVTAASTAAITNDGNGWTEARRLSTPLAQVKRMAETSLGADKENGNRLSVGQDEDDDNDEDGKEAILLQRPEFSLPIAEVDEEHDDTPITPPRMQALPTGEENHAVASIDFGIGPISRSPDKSPLPVQPVHASREISTKSRQSLANQSFLDETMFNLAQSEGDNDFQDDDDNNETIQSIEYGRRAVSEGPIWDKDRDRFYPRRSSFGSIRMSEFGAYVEEDGLPKKRGDEEVVLQEQELDFNTAVDDDVRFDIGDDTEELAHHHRPNSEPPAEDSLTQWPDQGAGGENSQLDRPQTLPSLDPDQGAPDAADEEPMPYIVDTAVSSENGIGVEAGLEPDIGSMRSPSLPSSLATISEGASKQQSTSRPRRRKKLKLAKSGNVVPTLPSSLIKGIAVDSVTRTGRKRPTIDGESQEALEQATEWFFEQVGEDLEVYSNHAKRRKRIDSSDVVTLMKRQRVLGRERDIEDLAEKYLPDEVLGEMRA